jgi:ribose transport system permease protein
VNHTKAPVAVTGKPPLINDRPADGPPTVSDPAAPLAARKRRDFHLERYGTIMFFVVFYAVVTALEGSKYLSLDNFLAVAGQNSHLAFAAAAVTITLIAGQFDLSVGSLVGLTAILTAGLTANDGVPILLAIVLVVFAGAAAGYLNGLLVTYAKVNAFIATLGTGTAFGGAALLYSKSTIIFDGIPQGLIDVANKEILGIPTPALFSIVLVVVAWGVTRQTVAGRYWYAIGANPTSAQLAGVNVRRLTIGAFVATGVLASFGGLMLTARFGSADPTSGPDFLLPAFAAAFLGSSILSDGRFTVVGSVVATYLIAFALNGLDVMGLSAGIKPIFNGAVLVGAVALTEELRRRRGRRRVFG